jgi:hypothetical protein
MPKQKTRKHLRGGNWYQKFIPGYSTLANNSSSPSHKNIVKTRLSYASLGEEATKIRAQQSQIATIVSTTAVGIAATSATSLAVGASLGIAGLVVPPVLPVMVAILVGIAFIMRQKGLNEELRSNLYFIKMEVERMFRSMNVINSIARERKIPLNTASLSIIMDKLQKRIMLFANDETKKDIQDLEAYLKEGKLFEGRKIIEQVTEDAKTAVTNGITNGITKKHQEGSMFRWLPTGWSSRWLSPDETLRQIIRDITIAVVWYSIMLSEFDIFNKYLDTKNGNKATQWASGPEMKELLIANRQLNDPRGEIETKLNRELAELRNKTQTEEIIEKIRVINEKLQVVSKDNDDFFYNPTQLAVALNISTSAISNDVQNAIGAELMTAAKSAAPPTAKSAAPPLAPPPPPPVGRGGTRRKRYSRRL